MTFVRRRIDLTFILGTGAFGDAGFNTVSVTGKRVQVNIQKTNGPGMGQAQVRVYGLTMSMMNQLSAINEGDMATRNNRMVISAGDDVSGMATVFDGNIKMGQINLSGAPDSNLVVVGYAGLLGATQIIPPSNYPGTSDAAVIMANLAAKMKLQFEPNNVSVLLETQYLPGSPREQAQRCADIANINWTVDDGVLAIWPKGGSRGGYIPEISPETGAVGYPGYSTSVYGIMLQTLFNPLLRIQGLVKVKSGLQVANGTWRIFNLVHDLESETPGGQWFTRFDGASLHVGAPK